MNSPGRGDRRHRLAAVSMSFVASGLLCFVSGLVMAVAAPVLVGTASAHGDDAIAELVAFTPAADGGSAQVTVRLTFQNDGDPVDDATVTISGDDAAGHTLTPATLDAGAQPGLFEGTLALPGPGTWNLRVTSIEPEASLTFTQTVSAAPTTTTQVAPTDPTAPTEPTVGAPNAPSGAIDPDEGAIDPNGGSSPISTDDGGSSAGWIVVVVAAVVLVAAIVYFSLRLRSDSKLTDEH